jgi:hypothetical protein
MEHHQLTQLRYHLDNNKKQTGYQEKEKTTSFHQKT